MADLGAHAVAAASVRGVQKSGTMSPVLLGLFVLSTLSSASAASSPDGCRVAVLAPEAETLGADDAFIAPVVIEALAGEVSRLSSCETITEADIASMIAFEGKKQELGCDADAPSCLSELGDALGVEEIVVASLTRVGSQVAIGVRRIDVVNVRIAARIQVFAEPTPKSLKNESQAAARALYAGDVSIVDDVDESESVLGPALMGTGFTFLGIGAVVAVVGLAGGGVSYAITKDATGDGGIRATTNVLWMPLLIAGAVGVGVAVVGAGVATAGFFF